MRLGIRGKLVGTLILAGILPLVLSLAVVLLAAQQAGRRFVGQAFSALAIEHSRHLSTLLSAEVDYIGIISRLPGTADFLREASRPEPLTPQQIREVEARWPKLPADDPLLRGILENDLARRWQAIRQEHPRIAEVLITDRTGHLVAATNRTTDYFQADEQWWTECHSEPPGQIQLREVVFDQSALSASGTPGVLVVNVCLPIHGSEPEPVGIVKVSLDAGWLLEQLRQADAQAPAGQARHLWLIDGQGRPLVAPGGTSPFARVPEDLMEMFQLQQDGYVIASGWGEQHVIGFASLGYPGSLLGELREWRVLITSPTRHVLASSHLLLALILAIGLVVIALCFAGGLWIAQREVIRPIVTLTKASQRLDAGHLNARLDLPGQPGSVFRHDELGALACAFNQMADNLERDVDALARADRTKEQFIDLASHELRTPLSYIMGVIELAQRRGTIDGTLLAKIASKTQRLNHIVGNMFKLVQSGDYDSTLRLGPMDLRAIVATAAAEAEPFLQMRGQKLRTEVPETLPSIEADADKVRDILNNLLTNAVRFSPDGSTLRIEVKPAQEAVDLTVSDQGPGIPDEDMERVFEPFYSSSACLAHHSSGEYQFMSRGMGLGLCVVKRFVDLHNGTIDIQSSPKGTRVRVRLPLAPAAQAEGRTPAGQPTSAP